MVAILKGQDLVYAVQPDPHLIWLLGHHMTFHLNLVGRLNSKTLPPLATEPIYYMSPLVKMASHLLFEGPQ